MWFWQSLGRPIVRYISHFFWSPKEKIVQSQIVFVHQRLTKNFLRLDIFFWSAKEKIVQSQAFFVHQRLNKNTLRLDNFFFGRPKKLWNRPNNWLTKRLHTACIWFWMAKDVGVASDGNFSSYLIVRSWYNHFRSFSMGRNRNNTIYPLLST